MIFTLIGMSSVGKSFWSQKLADMGFTLFCCDDLIEKKLEVELKHLGYKGIADVAHWMGMPYDPQYPQTSSRYLSLEGQVVREILDWIESDIHNNNVIIDTTGSVIYIDASIQKRLKALTKIVYLETTESQKEEMFRRFMIHPKPIIWGDTFTQRHNQSRKEALEVCYPKLLSYRCQIYNDFADVSIAPDEHKDPSFTIHKLLSYVPRHEMV